MAALPEGGAEVLLASVSDALVWYSPDGVVRWASPSLGSLFGWQPAEVIGTRLRLAPPEDAEESRRLVVDAVARGARGVTVRARALCADGTLRWAETRATFVWGADGRLEGSVASIRDITDEVEALDRYRLLAENASDVVYLRDADGVIEWVSPSVTGLLGHRPEDLVGTDTLDLLPAEDLSVGRSIRGEIASGGSVSGVVTRLRRADGSYVYGSVTSRPVAGAHGEVVGSVGGVRDVDALVRAERRAAAGERRLRGVLDTLLDPHVLLAPVRDAGGQIVDFTFEDVNPAACAYNGLDRGDIVGRRLLELLPGHAVSGDLEMYARVADTGESVSRDDYGYVNELLGAGRWYDVRAVRVEGGLVSLTWRDVTPRHEAARRLAESEERFRLLAESASDVVVHLRDGISVWVSPSVEAVLGGTRNEWVGLRVLDQVHPDDIGIASDALHRIEAGAAVRFRSRVRATDGEYHWVEVHANPHLDGRGSPDGIRASFSIIDSLVLAESELDRQAHVDALTGLVNRQEFLRRLNGLRTRPTRTGQRAALLFCDVDRFKAINDSHGHAVGDLVLQTLAARVRDSIRSDDIAARFGGDELLVLLHGVHHLDDARAVAETIRSAAARPIPVKDALVSTTVSVGVTLVEPGDDVDELVTRADQAMYLAKDAGRDQVVALPARPN